ncbi:porin family protein [Flavobacterium sp. ZS1P14]|uniref:porin family protein n=1 Tax=Flavobacterium sp. ZS1P14 TaxID=3401729 RepID=UPI003AAA89F9
MKKIILSVVIVFTFGFVNAQEKEAMSFGAKGGLNLATVTNADGSKTLVGFHIGFFGEFMLGDDFALQPEVLYSTQGTDFDNGDLKLDYITVPVMLKYYVADAFSLELGPQIGFLVSAEEDGVDIKSDVKSIDFGINFGASYDVTENFMLGARYNLGVTRWQDQLFPGESESKNSVFQISVGYKF